jgi:hypothetical protein
MRFARKLTKAEWRFAAGMAILIGCACAPSPRPTPLDFSGDWAGTTSQGRSITFTVSPGLVITRLSVDYAFGGCTGSLNVSPNVALLNTSGAAAAVVTYTPPGPTGSTPTVVRFLFPSFATANGSVDFGDFSTCGSSTATWTASKR